RPLDPDRRARPQGHRGPAQRAERRGVRAPLRGQRPVGFAAAAARYGHPAPALGRGRAAARRGARPQDPRRAALRARPPDGAEARRADRVRRPVGAFAFAFAFASAYALRASADSTPFRSSRSERRRVARNDSGYFAGRPAVSPSPARRLIQAAAKIAIATTVTRMVLIALISGFTPSRTSE